MHKVLLLLLLPPVRPLRLILFNPCLPKRINPKSDKTKTKTIDEKYKCKPCYPCLIRDDDHYKKYCTRRAKVTKFLQGASKPSTHVILSQPFPSQQQSQLVIHEQDTPSTSSYVLMCTGDSKNNDVAVANRAKDYSPLK
jgi:hypothetical protein